jgi:hypothetical protein
MCNGDFKVDLNELEENLIEDKRLYKVFTNYEFYLMVGLILTILILAYSSVCCHLYSDCNNKDGAFAFKNKIQPADTSNDYISDEFELSDEKNSIELTCKEFEFSKDSKDFEDESLNEGLNEPNIYIKPATEDFIKSIGI